MGQKVNPHGLRVGVIKDWDSKWYAEKDFADNLVEDYNIRTFLKKKLYSAGVAKIEIVCMAVASALVNGLLLLPAYGKAFGMPVDTFVEMGAAIIPAIHSLTTFCLFSVAPFNIIKGIVVSLITLVLYKHISRLLKGSQA